MVCSFPPSQDVHNKYYLDTVHFSLIVEVTAKKQTATQFNISVTLYVPLHKNKE